MLLDALFDTLSLPGFIIGTVAAAVLLWWLGLRDPFLLTLASLVVGGGCGAILEWRLSRTNSGERR